MTRDEFLGYCRHIMSAIGAIIAARGGPSASGYVELALGLGMIISSMVWSTMSKRYKKEGG